MTESYPQIVSERIFEENNKRLLDLELLTSPGTTGNVIKKINRSKSVAIKGFRVGKIPKNVIENYIGKQKVYVDKMVEQYNEIISTRPYSIISDPELENWSEEKNGSLKFKIKAEVLPEFDVNESNYLGIEVERDQLDEKKIEENYEKYLKHLEETYGVYKPVERGAKLGDQIALNLEVSVDGKIIKDVLFENKSIKLEEKYLGKELTIAITDTIVDKEVETSIAFAEDSFFSVLRSKTAVVKFKLESIKEMVPHSRDDELAQRTNLQVKTMDELKEKFSQEYTKQQDQVNQRFFELECMQKVLDNINLQIPQTMMTNEVKSLLNHRFEMFKQAGLPKEKAFENIDFNLLNEQAKNRIASALIFNKLYNKNIFKKEDVLENEIEKTLSEKAQLYDKKIEDIKKQYESVHAQENLKKEILYDKFMKQIVDNAKPIPRKPKEEVKEEVKEENV